MSAIDLDAARKAAREAQERAEKATPGPWRQGGYAPHAVMVGPTEKPSHVASCGPHSVGTLDDAAFIAAARSDVPDLAALVLAMADRIADLENEVRNHRVARNL